MTPTQLGYIHHLGDYVVPHNLVTPTLEQLRRRPALWIFVRWVRDAELRITMPDGTLWFYGRGPSLGGLSRRRRWQTLPANECLDWHKESLSHQEFAGWL